MRASSNRISLLGLTGVGVLFLFLAAGALSGTSPARAQSASEPGWLGVSLQDLDSRLREAMGIDPEVRGALVNRVVSGSPADRAGIRDGDVITEFDGERIQDVDDLMDAVRDRKAGDKVLVVVEHDGESRGLSTTLGAREEALESRDRGGVNSEVRDHLFERNDLLERDDPRRAPRAGKLGSDDDEDGDRVIEFHRRGEGMYRRQDAPRVMQFRSGGFLGVQTMALEGQLAEYFEVSEGVLVTEVVEDSPAEEAGLRAGDVITAVDGRDVDTPRDLQRRLGGMDPKDTVELSVQRRGSPLTVTVTLADRKDFGAVPEAPRDRLVFAVPRIPEIPEIEAIELPDLDRLEIHGLDALENLELPDFDWLPELEFQHKKLSKEDEARLKEKLESLRLKLDGLKDRIRVRLDDDARIRSREARVIRNELRDRLREGKRNVRTTPAAPPAFSWSRFGSGGDARFG